MPAKISFQRWSYALISSALALLILASFAVEKTIRRQLQADVRLLLEAVLKAETRGVKAWYGQQQLLAGTLARHPLILAALQGAGVTDDQLKAWLKQTPYLDFALAGPDARLIRSSQPQAGQAWASVSAQALQQARSGKIRLLETFVTSQGKRQTQLAMLAPVLNKGQVQGLLLLRLDPRRSFPSLLQGDSWGQSAETYLLDNQGVMLTPSRFESQLKALRLLPPHQSSALHLKVGQPAKDERQSLTPMAADLIAGRSGTRLEPYQDYRGVPVIGAWHWDSDLDLGIVTEIDAEEAFRSLHHTEWLLYGFTFFAVCLLLGMSRAYYKNHQDLARLTELITRREAHFHSIFTNSQDAILIFEGENILDCNPAALRLFGYARNELLGLAWHAVSPLNQPDGQSSLLVSRGHLLETTTGKKSRFDWRFENSRGEQFNVNMRLNPLQIGELIYCQATLRERAAETA